MANHISKTPTVFDEVFGDTSFLAIERALSRGDRTISPQRIAAAIEANPDKPLPHLMRTIVCSILRGKYKLKPGPTFSYSRELLLILAREHYRKILAELRAEKAKGTIVRERGDRELSWKAAKVTIEYLKIKKMSPGRLLNAFSERRAAQGFKRKRKQPNSLK